MRPFKYRADYAGELASMSCKKDERGVETLTPPQAPNQKPLRASTNFYYRKSLDELQTELKLALNEITPCGVRVDTHEGAIVILVALADSNQESLLDTRGVLGGIKRTITPKVDTKYNKGLKFETTLITNPTTEIYDFNDISRLFYKAESAILKCSEKFPLMIDLSEPLAEIKQQLDDAVKNNPEMASLAQVNTQVIEAYKIDPEMDADVLIYSVLPETTKFNGLPSAVRITRKVGDFSVDYFLQLSSTPQDLATLNLFFKTATDIVWGTFNRRVFDGMLGESTHDII